MSSIRSARAVVVGRSMCTALAVLALAVGCDQRPNDQTSADAHPWGAIIESARWAQNAHNVQSWQLRETADGAVIGGLAPERLLPQTDPLARQQVLSLGALSEAARARAAELGWALDAEWIAAQDWTAAKRPDADLFRWRLRRAESRPVSNSADGMSAATVKYRLAPRLIDNASAATIETRYSAPGHRFVIESDTARVTRTLELAQVAYAIEMRHAPTRDETLAYTRIGPRARRESPYGLTLKANFPRRSFWLIDRLLALLPSDPERFAEQGIAMFNDTVNDGRTLIVLLTAGNTPREWFHAGQPLQALWAAQRADGAELLPLSQGIQEYSQVAAQYEQLHQLWAEDGETLQMIVLVGQPRGRFVRSPRLPVSAIFQAKS